MNRRDMMKGSLAMAGAVSVAARAESEQVAAGGDGQREFYLIRRYSLNRGLQSTSMNKYFQEALLPALGRMGLGPVGVMSTTYGAGSPTMLVVIPGKDAQALTMLDQTLAKDAQFMAAAAPYWGTPASVPLFDRIDSSLSIAFEGFPKLVAPAKEPRILQIRTYESPNEINHMRKVEMFHQGEFQIFKEAGAKSVFYGDNLIGARLPSLTYMLCHKDMAALTENWKNFVNHPEWKKLSTNPRYASEPIVSRVDDLVFTPTAYSQI